MSCSLHHSGGVTIPPDTLHLTLMSSVLLLTTSSSVSLTQDVEDLADPGSFETISQPGNSIAELFEPIRDWKDWKREILNCSVKLPISQDVSLFACPDCGDQDQDDVLRCSVHQWLAFSVLILSISFTLGLGMVDKFRFLRGGNLSTLIIMMIIKCILAPISSHFPPALGVRAYASQYGVTPELVSAGIVLCTAVSAPLMFLSAQILTILSISSEEDQLSSLTRSLDYHMAIFSIVGVSVILTIFLVSRRHAQLPHCFTTALLVQSLVAPLSAVLIHHHVISPSLGVSPQSDSAQKNNKCKWSQHSPCNISNGVSSVLKKTVEDTSIFMVTWLLVEVSRTSVIIILALRTVLQLLAFSVLILSISPQYDSAQKNNKCKWSQHSPCNISNGVSSVLKKTVEI